MRTGDIDAVGGGSMGGYGGGAGDREGGGEAEVSLISTLG